MRCDNKVQKRGRSYRQLHKGTKQCIDILGWETFSHINEQNGTEGCRDAQSSRLRDIE